jgi:hypothetical protein
MGKTGLRATCCGGGRYSITFRIARISMMAAKTIASRALGTTTYSKFHCGVHLPIDSEAAQR